ncbi:MAG: FAD:protein FMN transferase [Huintestinicola sp.]|uniref:FAD:protein FMN transferase n=1 Tax=Huintestinicola sp. TaxID=2981661 RepID=UPI003F0E88DD
MKKAAVIFGISVFSLLCGCADRGEPCAKKDLFAMDTYMTMTAYGENAEAALDKACSEITRLEGLFSVTDTNSDIAGINSSDGQPVEISRDTAELIRSSSALSEMTDGAVDITVYPLVREWGFTTGNYSVPTEKRINELIGFTGYSNISISDNKVTVPANYQLDLGSVAKGYAGEKAAEILRNEGVTSAILSLGGNIQTIGEKPDGTPWRVAVTDPVSPSDTVCTLSVRDKAVVTSGNYQRYFICADGKKYCHIIDPETGYPVDNGLASVTVTGDSGTYCDGLSTALFVMGEEKAVSFWKDHRDFEMLIITEDGRIIMTENLSENIGFADNTLSSKAEVIK